MIICRTDTLVDISVLVHELQTFVGIGETLMVDVILTWITDSDGNAYKTETKCSDFTSIWFGVPFCTFSQSVCHVVAFALQPSC